MTPRFAYSANAYMRCDVLEAIRRIAEIGYRGIELMADAPHLWPAETTPQTLDAVRAALEQRGLAISNINAFMMNRIGDPRQPYWHPSWLEPDRRYRQVRIDHTLAALVMARDLGSPHITTEPGGPKPDGMTWRNAFHLFVEMLKPVVERAEQLGVRLLVEPEPGLLIERCEQYLELADRIASPALGLNFDVGHAYCVREDPAEWIPRMREHTVHYHLEDIAATRVHEHLVPGRGAIDFRAVLAAIGQAYFNHGGWATVELYPCVDDPDGAGRSALACLHDAAADL